jgi:hypothetical protein
MGEGLELWRHGAVIRLVGADPVGAQAVDHPHQDV